MDKSGFQEQEELLRVIQKKDVHDYGLGRDRSRLTRHMCPCDCYQEKSVIDFRSRGYEYYLLAGNALPSFIASYSEGHTISAKKVISADYSLVEANPCNLLWTKFLQFRHDTRCNDTGISSCQYDFLARHVQVSWREKQLLALNIWPSQGIRIFECTDGIHLA